jgi:hypothetical protein
MAETHFPLFQGKKKKRAKKDVANMTINGDKKYTKRKRKNTKKNRRQRKKKKKVARIRRW